MRNYVGELHAAGLPFTEIQKQTGINVKKLSRIARDIQSLKASSKDYKILRNTSRRTAYTQLRESGVSAKMANKYRRIGLSQRTYFHETTRNVSHTNINKIMYQLKMLAEFINQKTKERKFPEPDGVCFSLAHAQIDETELSGDADSFNANDEIDNELINEAIRDGQAKLGGSNWELLRIVDIEVITYKIG